MTNSMRIGITCYPTFGGSGIIATEIGLSLARRGHHVHFISYDIPCRLDRFVQNAYFHAVEARGYALFDPVGHGPYALALASKMVEVSTYERLDLLHVHYAIPHAASAYLARQILGERAPRIVTTLHGTDITLVGSDPSYLPITRFSIVQSDGVTAPSHYLRQVTYDNFSISATETPIEVIPNFVDTGVYRPAPPEERRDLGHLFPGSSPSGGRPPVLIHNSNFRLLKRTDDVVRIFALVRERVPALLVLIGDGPERSRAESLVRELGLSGAVVFLGKQLNFVDVLRRADVFLLPSASESFGLAALEALACGVPVVASRVGGVPEVIDDGETGLLCPMGDVRSMADAVLRILGDEELHGRMARRARAVVEERWEREAMVTRYEAYCRRVLDGGSGATSPSTP